MAAGQDHHIMAREGVGLNRDLVDAVDHRVHQDGRMDIGLDPGLAAGEPHRRTARNPCSPSNVTSCVGRSFTKSAPTWPSTGCHSPTIIRTRETAELKRNAHSAPSASIFMK